MKKKDTELLHKFFKQIWDDREDEEGNCYCYETGRQLPFSYRQNSCCYHHILSKSKYPEYAFEDWNIMILHPDVHTQVESNINKCPKVLKLTQQLKEQTKE